MATEKWKRRRRIAVQLASDEYEVDHCSTYSKAVQGGICQPISRHANARTREIWHFYSGSARITDSKATRAMAFAGKARRKHGKKPLQYPFHPCSRYTAFATSRHRGNFRSGPNGSVIIRCLITSLGYDVIQKTWADKPPAQKFTAGAERFVCVLSSCENFSYDPHQKQKKVRKRRVALRPCHTPRMPWPLYCTM